MKFIIWIAITFFVLTACDNSTIGRYKKEPLPNGFTYRIIEDRSDTMLEKNQLTVEINMKIDTGQIASLAAELFSIKDPQRRFYIYYLLPGMRLNAGVWATSHFDPDLKIDILGSTSEQDSLTNTLARQIEGEIIGIWHEEQFTSSNYVMLKKDGQVFINTIFKTGQVSEERLNAKETALGTCYHYDEGGYDNEYFIINPNGDLDFYNKEHINFTTALKLQP